MDNKKDKICVATTTYNDYETIDRFIQEMINQTMKPYRIIITDGGSSPNYIKILKDIENRYGCVTILYVEKCNIAEGINLSVLASDTEYVFITTLGNRYPTNIIEEFYQEIKNEKYDVVCPCVVGDDYNQFSKNYGKVYLNRNKGINGIYCLSHGSLLSRQMFLEKGMFYEKLLYAGEDAEFYHFGHKSGVRFFCKEEIKVIWEVPSKWSELKKKEEVYGIGALQIFSTYELIKNNKVLLLYIMWIFVSLLLGFFKGLGVMGIMMAIIFVVFFWRESKGDIKCVPMAIVRTFYKPIIYMRNFKYHKNDYVVNRTKTHSF